MKMRVALMMVVIGSPWGALAGESGRGQAAFEAAFRANVERYFHERCRNQIPASLDLPSFAGVDWGKRGIDGMARLAIRPLFHLGNVCESYNDQPAVAKHINEIVQSYTCHYGGRGEQRVSLRDGKLELWVDPTSGEDEDSAIQSHMKFLGGVETCYFGEPGERREGRELCQNDDYRITYLCDWRHNEKDGVERRWTRDGRFLIEETYYKKGVKHGTERIFSEADGSLVSESNYQDGKREGIQKEYHHQGKGGVLAQIAHFANGDRRGEYRSFHENGKPRETSTIGPGGEKVGLYEFHSEKGFPIERSHYAMLPDVERSVYHGRVEHYSWDDGKPTEVSQYVYGKRHGLQHKYDSLGKIETSCYQDDHTVDGLGLCTGQSDRPEQVVTRYESGTVREEYTAQAGRKNGPYRELFEDGKPRLETAFREDELHGPYREYSKQGTLTRTAGYENGKLHGTETLYFDDGKNKIVTEWQAGVKRASTEYFQNGRPRQVRAYSDQGLCQASVFDDRGRPESEGSYKVGVSPYHGEWEVRHGTFTFYSDGQLRARAQYQDGEQDGPAFTYHPNGKVQLEETYQKGHLRSVKHYDKGGHLQLIEKLNEDGSHERDTKVL